MKKVIISVLCGVLALVLVLFVPIPTKINKTMSGQRLYQDMSEQEITMSVDGWHWRSLIGYDRVDISIDILDSNTEAISYRPAQIRLLQGVSLYSGAFSRYSKEHNAMVGAAVYADEGLSVFLVSDNKAENFFYVASDDLSISAQEILELIRLYIIV